MSKQPVDLNLRINGSRLWDSLMTMAQIGATDKGGCNRQALTGEDRQGRQLFIAWCRELGCTITIDKIGNIFALYAGSNKQLPPVMIGSHLDTQPTGGKFDGVYGVLAGLEVIRTLHQNNIVLPHPIEIAVWTNEEGARFAPAMLGSGVWSGNFSLDYGLTRTDKDSVTLAKALQAIDFNGDHPASYSSKLASFELHIEQGPILEKQAKQIGVVTGVQGFRWYDLIIEGNPCHAGPTPMSDRQDPFMGLNIILDKLYARIAASGLWGRVTFGNICAEPGSRNTVPQLLKVAVDLRHPKQAELDAIDADFRSIATSVAEQFGLVIEIVDVFNSPVIEFDKRCINAIKQSLQTLAISSMEMVSGAGHDSVYVSKVVPTAMIFIPSVDGLSHNEAEYSTPEDIEAGANVLLHALGNIAL